MTAPTTAIVTASYAPDFDRCRLLCETIDSRLTGYKKHYILVEHRDVALFRQLESSRRLIVDERDILPNWLRPFWDPLSFFRRRIWISGRTVPLRGWHVQQLRRIAIAFHADEDALFYCDSDAAFLKPFDCRNLWHGSDLRLFRRDNALLVDCPDEQRQWSCNAARTLGLSDTAPSPHDYIGTLIAWRRDSVRAMCDHVEQVHDTHWAQAIAADRRFSECMIYGRYVDDVISTRDHFHDATELCRVYWFEPAPSEPEFRAFVSSMDPSQVAIGMQSFLGVDMTTVRNIVAGNGSDVDHTRLAGRRMAE